MVWLVIDGEGSLYGSEKEGLTALGQVLEYRRKRGYKITPNEAPVLDKKFYAANPARDGLEIIYLTHEEPSQSN